MKPTESLDKILALGHRLHQKRPDLQAAFEDPDGPEFWAWLQTHGRREPGDVRALCIPLPPLELQHTVTASDEWGFLLVGASIYLMLQGLLKLQGKGIAQVGPILDFGCGSGRGFRFLQRHAPLNCVGIDIDPKAIAWCARNLTFGRFHVCPVKPPTVLEPASFGLIYSISVFSHLSEESHLEWLRELRRLVHKSGTIVITVHGRRALTRAIAEAGMRAVLGCTERDLKRAERDLTRHGFAFIRQPDSHLNPSLYGVTFHTEAYIRNRWSEWFEVMSYDEGLLNGWQDTVVMKPR